MCYIRICKLNVSKSGSELLMMQCTTSTAGAFLQKLLQTESGRVDNKRLSHVLVLREIRYKCISPASPQRRLAPIDRGSGPGKTY